MFQLTCLILVAIVSTSQMQIHTNRPGFLSVIPHLSRYIIQSLIALDIPLFVVERVRIELFRYEMGNGFILIGHVSTHAISSVGRPLSN